LLQVCVCVCAGGCLAREYHIVEYADIWIAAPSDLRERESESERESERARERESERERERERRNERERE
jgi:hypothetical protein